MYRAVHRLQWLAGPLLLLGHRRHSRAPKATLHFDSTMSRCATRCLHAASSAPRASGSWAAPINPETRAGCHSYPFRFHAVLFQLAMGQESGFFRSANTVITPRSSCSTAPHALRTAGAAAGINASLCRINQVAKRASTTRAQRIARRSARRTMIVEHAIVVVMFTTLSCTELQV